MDYGVISSDSHVNEPRDLWQERLPSQLRPMGLKVVECADGGEGWTHEGNPPKSFGLGVGSGDKTKLRAQGKRFSDINPGNYDPLVHLKDQDRDGVDASVMFPGQAMFLSRIENKELRIASFQVYNDWLVEDFASANPSRIIPLAMLPVDDDIEDSLVELDRSMRKGHRGAIIPLHPVHRAYTDPYYEPLWQQAAMTGFPLHFHKALSKRVPDPFAVKPSAAARVAQVVLQYTGAMEPIALMVFSGVFHRNPSLKVVSAESDFGWWPFFEQNCDAQWERQQHWARLELTQKPSEYFKRQVYVTFQDDYVGCSLLKFVGSDNFMWASDYPHSVSSWPNSRSHIKEVMANVGEDDKRKLLAGNAIRIYKL